MEKIKRTNSVRVHYNSPVILTFSIVVIVVRLVSAVWPGFTTRFFTIGPSISLFNPLDLVRLVSHVIGHASFEHLLSNLTLLLLLGPILEEKYGSVNLVWMMLVTAFATGIINVLFFATGLLGASGIVFMLIILASVVNLKENTIPLSFILVFCIFVGNELIQSFARDNISQMAHIVGGGIGALFGFKLARGSGQGA
jgi:membrane associated rhomboid family serine protease